MISKPVVSDLDVWRAANMMVKEHGIEAELEACRMADRLLGWGDIEGQRTWLRIRRALVELQIDPSGKPHWGKASFSSRWNLASGNFA